MMATTGPTDDRPWLAAHGDGIVYYIQNNGAVVSRGPEQILDVDEEAGAGQFWFYRSEDGGMTWSAGMALHGSNWCTTEASPIDDKTVFVACTALGETEVRL